MTTKKDIINYYDETLGDYQTVWMDENTLALHYGYWDRKTKDHFDSLLRMNGFLADVARIRSSDKILDAGCGIGGSSIWLAREIGANVTGITLSSEQVALAKKYSKSKGVGSKTRFYRKDFTKTGFKSGSFSLVWAIESVCHAEKKEDFVSETHRILKKGGRLVVADFFIRRKPKNAFESLILDGWLNGWEMPNFASIGEFEGFLKSYKFKKIQIHDITKHIIKSSWRLFSLCIKWLPLNCILYVIRKRNKTQVKNLVAGVLQYLAFKTGICAYCAFYAEK